MLLLVMANDRFFGTPQFAADYATWLFSDARSKPADRIAGKLSGLIVGMYQQFGDQVGENSALVRELGSMAH
jgi:hypothetical protein